jgi:hypothetical protein
MNALSERRTVFLLLAALIASPALFACEYGLTVDPSFPHPCKYAATRTLNECTPAAVVKDLRGHFISGKPFRLRAAEMAVRSGDISLSPDALPAFNDAIVAMCAVQTRTDSLSLVRFLSYLPYSSLRQRLASEIEVTERPEVRSRLQEALRALPKAPLSAPETACALFGFQGAAHAALEQRRRK